MADASAALIKPLLVFLGGGAGTLMRYWLGGAVHAYAGGWGATFPLGTLVVNVSGCFAVGFLASVLTGPMLVRDEYRTMILIGILGGYTTFSTFGRESMALIHDGEWLHAAANIILSVFLGLAAVWLGDALATKMYGLGAP